MKEEFLHFVWKSLNFRLENLQTTTGEPIHILKTGTLNTNQGPDFLQAKVQIGKEEWTGSVEMHLTSQDWYAHKHEKDEKYNNVMLHVVEKSTGKSIVRQDGTICPEVEIGELIPKDVYAKYEQMQATSDSIPCAAMIASLPKFTIYQWISSLAIGRVQEKAEKMQFELQKAKYDWEQVAWKICMGYMGGTINGEAFQQLAEILPYDVVKKYVENPFQLEALLFGTWLDSTGEDNVEESDVYLQKIWQEYQYLKEKHELTIPYPIHFSYFRMRPVSFPEIRLAQMASLLHQFPDFIRFLAQDDFQTFLKTEISVSDYWESHYKIKEISSKKTKNLGKDQKEVLIINLFLPFGYLYKQFHGADNVSEILENTLTKLKAENNHVVKLFQNLNITCENALHSQGIIQLKKNYCDMRKCLICSIGYKIINQK